MVLSGRELTYATYGWRKPPQSKTRAWSREDTRQPKSCHNKADANMRLSLPFPGLALLAATSTAEAFVPRSTAPLAAAPRGGGALDAAAAATVAEVPTSPIAGMRPGTSGLRKKVEVWQEGEYIENFIQSLIDTAKASEGGKLDT